LIEVIDERQTGETLLDEALKMMKSSEKYGTGAWVDLMSGKSAAIGSDSCRLYTHHTSSYSLLSQLFLRVAYLARCIPARYARFYPPLPLASLAAAADMQAKHGT